ncbi:PBP1A family penicillin-binding protein [Gorillibacterium sp. sgz5001074]|uniref:transglycosylase domain-containing protein n=1 Tax=Gorillibacterium sp. sgz5001074 TaxID=3446695 RepID=UPI003F67385B
MTGLAKDQAVKPKKPRKKSRFTFGKLMIAMGITAALAIVCALIGYMVIIYNGEKIFSENEDKLIMTDASRIYDANDNVIATLATENRELVEPGTIPDLVQKAFIATEDRRFNEHGGVDLWAIGRALVKDIVARSAVEGGSTITQQLAKNMFLNSDKTFFRKGTEMSIALALENHRTKDEILTLYLNRIFFGSRAYGIKAASKVYFGKSDLKQLTLDEIATLAAIPKAPSTYNPIKNPEKSKERRNVVLKLMYDQGYITEEQKNAAQAKDYTPQPAKGKDYQAFTDYVLDEAEELYKLDEDKIMRGGYKIYTTMVADAQKTVETAFDNPKLFQKDGPEQKMQGSMVIVNNKDGGIVAMSGGRDYVNKGLNRATATRQPGSAFKPLIVYAPAIEKGPYNPYTMLKDEETTYDGGYSPRNYDGVYKGEISMLEAVRKSANAPAVWLLNQIKVSYATGFVKNMGITLDKGDANLAIALGGLTKGVSPLQMAQAYSAFPNNGMMPKAHAIRIIEDGEGNRTTAKSDRTKVMSPKTAYYMTELLKGVVDGGTGTAARMNRPVAGKTGTTQLDLKGLEKNNRDVWFVGYTPEWSAAVWMGFDKTDAKHYVLPASGSYPAAMFKEVMSKAMAKMPVTSFTKPEGVADLKEPPKTVTNLTAEYVKESKKVVLKWTSDAGSDLGTYQIFRKEAKETEAQQLAESKEGLFEDRAIVPGASYEYYVTPFNPQSGEIGTKSNSVTVAVPAAEGASPSPGVSGSPGASPGSSPKPGESVKPGNGSPAKPGASGAPGAASPTPTPSASGSPKASPSPAGSNPPASPGQPSPSSAPAAGGEGGASKPAGQVSVGGLTPAGGDSANR